MNEVIYGFGLGLLFGIFILMVIGLLGSRKKIKMFEDEINSIRSEFRSVWDETQRIERYIDSRVDEVDLETHNEFQRIESYIDSRVDRLDQKFSKK
jgi:predicted  nucleic acid-binding Zn-ribbon protein